MSWVTQRIESRMSAIFTNIKKQVEQDAAEMNEWIDHIREKGLNRTITMRWGVMTRPVMNRQDLTCSYGDVDTARQLSRAAAVSGGRCPMFSLILGLLLVSSVAQAAVLDVPTPHTTLSGVGVIHGWKCEAGDLTVRFDGGPPLPLLHGAARQDVLNAGGCDSAQVGFVSIMNWGELGDGQHTAVVYDNGVEFDRSTFDVVTTGEAFLRNASGQCVVEDFPAPGEEARFIWNQATQHMELAEVGSELTGAVHQGTCMEEMTLQVGQSCTGYHGYFGFQFTFRVDQFSHGCLETFKPEGPELDCEPERMWDDEIGAERNPEGSWEILWVADPNPDDHGDTPETATALHVVPGGSITETVQFAAWSDEDYFAIHVPAGVRDNRLTIVVYSFGISADLIIATADGTMHAIIERRPNAADDDRFTVSLGVNPGTYYLRLFLREAYQWVRSASYTVTFQLSE